MPQTYRRLGDRNPYELYLLIFAVASSLPAAIGVTPAPGTIRVTLDPLLAQMWAGCLFAGSAVALVGLSWKRPRVGLSVTGLLLEQVGLVCVGVATLFYSLVALTTVGLSALTPVGTVLAFGIASFAQAEKIQNVMWALNNPDEPPRSMLIPRILKRSVQGFRRLVRR